MTATAELRTHFELNKEGKNLHRITWHNRISLGFVRVFKHYLLYLDWGAAEFCVV